MENAQGSIVTVRRSRFLSMTVDALGWTVRLLRLSGSEVRLWRVRFRKPGGRCHGVTGRFAFRGREFQSSSVVESRSDGVEGGIGEDEVSCTRGSRICWRRDRRSGGFLPFQEETFRLLCVSLEGAGGQDG